MPYTSKLTKRAQEQGKTEEELIIEAFKSDDSFDGAAQRLGLWPNSLRQELRKRGLRVVIEKQVSVRLEKVDTL